MPPGESGALTRAVRGPLRRAHVSFAATWAGESAFMVALSVVAFREGGPGAVGVVTAVRMAMAALLSPFLATVADRIRRERVLTSVGVVRAVALGTAAAVTAADGPALATYLAAVVATAALALFRPAHSALLPALAKSPSDLTSANAVRGMLDSLSTLGGPVMAGVVLSISDPAVVFALCAALSLLGGLAVLALPYDPPPRGMLVKRSPGRDVAQGFVAIAGDRHLSLITGLGVVQTFTRGCLTVFAVVVAIELLDLGNPGVAVLNAAVGAGGVLGSIGAFALLRRGGLGTWFGVGIALFGAPLVLVGALPTTISAIVFLGLVGAGNALVDVTGFTLLARLTDEKVLARMFAAFEAVLTLGVALGGLAAPLMVETLGPRGGLVAVGLLAPAVVLATLPAQRRLDAEMQVRDADIAVLRAVPMLRTLPAATIAQLGDGLQHAELAPGAVVFEQGDEGDRFYVVKSGIAEVLQQGRVINTLGPGDGFGEVALLHETSRTATVRAGAGEPLRVAVLERSRFLTAVTGYPSSAAVARDVVSEVRQRDASRADHPENDVSGS
jgi:MFS family permease